MEDKPTVFLPLGELKTQEEKVMCLSPHHGEATKENMFIQEKNKNSV